MENQDADRPPAGDSATWIQYNYTSQLWHCCGDGGCSGTPTDETFQAAPPEQFSAVPSGPQSSSSSSTPTSAPTATFTPAPADGLSSGAKAGIGVAAAVAGIAIVAAIAFFVLWRRARKTAPSHQVVADEWKQEQGMQQGPVYAHYGSQPANYYKPPEEMSATQVRTPELAAEEAGNRLK